MKSLVWLKKEVRTTHYIASKDYHKFYYNLKWSLFVALGAQHETFLLHLSCLFWYERRKVLLLYMFFLLHSET